MAMHKITFAGYIFGICFWLVLLIIETFAPGAGLLYGTLPKVFSQPVFWMTNFIIILLCVIPVYIFVFMRRSRNPTAWQILLELQKQHKSEKKRSAASVEMNAV